MTIRTLHWLSDSAILIDLQAIGTSVPISDYSTVDGSPTVTWESEPAPEDQNNVTAYFQQNNQLRSWA